MTTWNRCTTSVDGVAPRTTVSSPSAGPRDSSGPLVQINYTDYELTAMGTSDVSFQVPVTGVSQLDLPVNGNALNYTELDRATGTSQLSGDSLITTTSAHSILNVRNPARNFTAPTMTPGWGGTRVVGASLVIHRLQ